MKKLFCLLLVAVLTLGLMAVGHAEGEEKIRVGLSLNLQDETNVRFQKI